MNTHILETNKKNTFSLKVFTNWKKEESIFIFANMYKECSILYFNFQNAFLVQRNKSKGIGAYTNMKNIS